MLDTQVIMTPAELEIYLNFVFANPGTNFVPIIAGPPGCGKSDIVSLCAKVAQKRLIVSHPVTADPTDYKGLGALIDGKAKFLPFNDLTELIETTKPIIFFLDDVGQAPHAVQAALMQLVLGRRVNGHVISDLVQFVMATNRKSDKAGVSSLLEPLKGRGQMINLEPSHKDWLKWAVTHDMPSELTAFINFRPDFITDFKASAAMTNSPTPRTIAAVGRHLNAGVPKEVEFAAYAGCAGEEFAREFTGFLQIFRKIPNPQNCIMNPTSARVPDPQDISTLYAICGALARLATDQNIGSVLKYADRLPEEFTVCLVKEAVDRNFDLQDTPEFTSWAIDKSDLFA